jgi:YYY domain-containing protein
MLSFLTWYLLITFLGWLTFPLAYHLFPALIDRGYTLSRAFGLLVWGYVFWLFASLGIAQNDIGGLLLGLVILGGLSAWMFVNQKSEVVNWLRENRPLIITTELLFLTAFALMAFFRSANPEILGTEKPMELMFINGIMNSPTFPPRDLWLSGYSISYYHFGYVMTSMLALFTGVPATMAFNLMIALIFGLSAVVAYGILYNLLANPLGPHATHHSEAKRSGRDKKQNTNLSSFLFPLFGPLFLLLISNVEGFLEILHRKGFFWQFNADGTATSGLWTWLDIKELRDAPLQPLQWIPERFWWWWRASRVVQDYDLNGTWRETIDEFPFFSYLLGDLHPHVLAMPFTLLAIAVALNLFLGGWRGNINLFFGQLRISRTGFFVMALVLGGLAFLNTWDILVAAALIVFSYALARVREAGWSWERIEDVLLLGIPVAITAFVMYLPFYIGFDSQAGGLTPNFMYPTRGAHLWVMWGTLFIPLFALLIYLWRSGAPAHWRTGLFTGLGILLMLLAAMFVIGLLALRLKPDLVNPILQSQGLDISAFITDSMIRRLTYVGSLLTLMALMIPTFSFLAKAGDDSETTDHSIANRSQSVIFVLLLIALGSLLILGPDFVYLRDNFGYRINSVFKFYYQAWILLSLAAAYGIVLLLRNLRGAANAIFSTVFAIVLIVGLTYPALGIFNKTNNFKPPYGYTLDDFDRVQRENPDEAAAIQWLQSAPDGVIVEATRPSDAYSAYARISIYTGLPTVIGWGNHEGQWREQSLQGSRVQDVETLYSTTDWVTTQDIINRYNIRYVYVGNLERSSYRVSEDKFNRFLKPVFQQGNVTIYEVP